MKLNYFEYVFMYGNVFSKCNENTHVVVKRFRSFQEILYKQHTELQNK